MVVKFRGGLTCECVADSLPWVEADLLKRGLIKESIDIFQLGYRTDVSASAGTHARGGCVDVGQYHLNQITVWREWGWTMQRRDLTGVVTHGHGWPYKCDHLSVAAQKQEADWDRKDAGLQGDAQVVGLWPVKPWKIAGLENVMSLVDDAVAALAERTAIKTLRIDGEIENNGFKPKATAGEFVSLASALEGLGDDTSKILTLLAEINSKLK